MAKTKLSTAHATAANHAGHASVGGPRTYKLIELVGTSNESYEKAIENAIRDASRTVRGMAWFEVAEMRGQLRDGVISEFQVTLKIGFRILDKE